MSSYEHILSALSQANVAYIVGGGVACVFHGVERVTMDVDVAIHMDQDNIKKFIETMAALGLKPRVPLPPSVLLDPQAVQMMVEEKHALVFTFVDPDRPLRQVDLFIHPSVSYETLLPDSVETDLGSSRVRLLSKRKLLAMKKAITPPRLKDQMDIEYLEKHLND